MPDGEVLLISLAVKGSMGTTFGQSSCERGFLGFGRSRACEPQSSPYPGSYGRSARIRESSCWVLVKGIDSSCHNQETLLFTIAPYCGNLNSTP